MPHMLKKRTPYGLLMSVGSLIEPLKENELLQEKHIEGPWSDWWRMARSDDFYSEDTYILSPAEFSRARHASSKLNPTQP